MLASEVTVSYTHLDVYKRQELMKANAVLESVPAIKNQKIMTISYDELMDYGPAVIDSLEKINDFINK